MAEIEVAPETKNWLAGGKTYTGIIVVLVPVIASMFGYDVREVFPVEVARFGTELITLIGACIAFYGRWAAKTPAWFSKK